MPYIPDTSFNYAAPGGQLDVLRSMSPQQLLNMRTQDRIAQGAPALSENARQFNVGTAENARQFDLSNALQNQQLQAQVQQAKDTLGYNYANLEAQVKQAADSLGFNYANMNSQERQAAESLAEQARQYNTSDAYRNRALTSQEQQALQQLQENARQFNLTNEQYYAGLGEKARESDISTQLGYDQLSSQQLLNQLNTWLNNIIGIH